MNITDWLGSIGVFMILLAYILSVKDLVSTKELSFILLNFVGALLACSASILLNYIPFIILEGAWALVSLSTLLKYKKV
ncbi:hypothetical protein D7030_02100 [Flavobacteriaceae bacterium AU392]|nr:hypothetical protein D1817_08575 [Flavobacteriaceae bacterium]RKM85489.1 hypothetical protein D7030_02100 [Flavobacteriaceae bacterium AU392]